MTTKVGKQEVQEPDKEPEELTLQPYDWTQTESDIETGEVRINIYCLDRESNSVYIRIQDFPYYCQVELPRIVNGRLMNWNRYFVDCIYQHLKMKLGEDAPKKAIFKSTQKLYYYNGQRQYPVMMLTFKNKQSMDKCEGYLKKGKYIEDIGFCVFNVNETQIHIERKLLTLRNSAHSQWFKIQGTRVSEEDKVSFYEREYVVDWKTYTPYPINETKSWITYPKILSFDIECYSDNHRTMPNAYFSAHVVNMISCIFQKMNHIETRRRICILLGKCDVISYSDICLSFKKTIEAQLPTLTQQQILIKWTTSAFVREIVAVIKDICKDQDYIKLLTQKCITQLMSNEFTFTTDAELSLCISQLLGDNQSEVSTSHLPQIQKIVHRKAPEIRCVQTEPELCDEFSKLIQELDPDIITGYNILGFDYPYLHTRVKRRMNEWKTMGRLRGIVPQLESKTWKSSAYSHQDINTLIMDGRISVDMLPIIRRDHKLSKYDLGTVSTHFLSRTKHDIKAQEMFKIYEDFMKTGETHELTKVVRYCIEDSELTLDLFEKMNTWIGLIELSNIVGIKMTDLFTRGQQIRCISQIFDLATKLDFMIDKREIVADKFTGAYVHEPLPGLYDDVSCIDFKSLYPSIIMAFNICYTTLVRPEDDDKIPDDTCHVLEWKERIEEDKEEAEEDDVPDLVKDVDVDDEQEEDSSNSEVSTKKTKTKEPKYKSFRFKFVKQPQGIVPQLVQKLVQERRNVVAEQKKEEKDSLVWTVMDKRQWALKISANSIFGFLGARNGMLPLPEAAKCITAKGRELINQCNEYLVKEHNALIVYNDTDSSLFKLPNITSHKQALEEGEIVKDKINKLFPKPLEVELEKTGLMLSIRKKKYAFWPIDEKTFTYKTTADGKPDIMMKGIILARRDNCFWQRKVYNKVLLNVMFRKPLMTTYDYIITKCYKMLQGKVSYKDLIIIRELGSHYKSPSYFMKIFSDELVKLGKPASPGERLEHVIVKSSDPTKKLLGYKLRLPDTYLENSEMEPIDSEYYIEKILKNNLEQLFQVGYKTELDEMKLKYRRMDRKYFFYSLIEKGYYDKIMEIAQDFKTSAPELTDDQIEEYVIEYLCTTNIKNLAKKMRTQYIGRKNIVSARITSTPIKDFLKMYRLYLEEQKE